MHYYFIFCIFLWLPFSGSSRWSLPQLHIAALGSSSSISSCDRIPGLSPYQRRTCRTNPALMNVVADGIRHGVSECQRQFVNYRWNCTSVERNGIGQIVLKPGSSESAFVYAITSAGVMYSIARACSKGDLANCHCDKRWINKGRDQDEQGYFHWGGCSDNIPYSSNMARRFVDANDRSSRDARALMNLHNNRAGRKIVRRSPEKRCKCHGISGSCGMRTCWWSLPKFDTIGDVLRRKYDSGLQVTINRQGVALAPIHFDTHRRYDSPQSPTSWNTDYGRRKKSNIDPLSLVFFDPSPDYCNRDTVFGYPGTGGRRCNRTSIGPDGCDSMCCGRGFDTTQQLKTRRCGCRFIYCCEVICEQCSEWEDVHTCKRDSGNGILNK